MQPPPPPPPREAPQPATPPAPAAPPIASGAATDVSNDDRIMAGLCHASALVFAVLGPAILYVAYKDRSTFVAFHALQALVFQAVTGVATVVLAVLTCGVGALFIFPVWGISLYWALKAYNGERTPYPLLETVVP